MIVVTGATGQLGRLVVEGLKEKAGADRVVAAVRAPEKAADLGVEVREAHYDRPETLKAAFAGAEVVLLISGTDHGNRVRQHSAVIDAAKEAGARVVYTSAPYADTTTAKLVGEHRATETYLRASGVPFTILRNSWYHENYQASIAHAPQAGAIFGAAGEGRVASAARADYAAAAVAVLTGEGHTGETYELSGDTAWSLTELAAAISAASGTAVTYTDLPEAEFAKVLAANGLPEAVAGLLADVDTHIAQGWLERTPGTLAALIGRPTQPIGDYMKTVI
ncbi:SDR family oxidoreductase [Actinocorallia longicatena]|uniref:SDR family oxidoreductase n=1 Tax=Actinocorallia longicatena TaxID=111803 RepID=A0ABP6Q6A8_9ACTN